MLVYWNINSMVDKISIDLKSIFSPKKRVRMPNNSFSVNLSCKAMDFARRLSFNKSSLFIVNYFHKKLLCKADNESKTFMFRLLLFASYLKSFSYDLPIARPKTRRLLA